MKCIVLLLLIAVCIYIPGCSTNLKVPTSSDNYIGTAISELQKNKITENVEYILKSKYRVGNTVKVGTYIMSYEDSEPWYDEIVWNVIDVDEENHRILLISNKILDGQPYNTNFASVTWETCTLRAWLNDDFYNTAFLSSEQAIIADTEYISSEEKVIDKIFLLTESQVDEYLQTGRPSTVQAIRAAQATRYSYEQGVSCHTDHQTRAKDYYYENGDPFLSDSSNAIWWLLSDSEVSDVAACVTPWGAINNRRMDMNKYNKSAHPCQ